MIYGPINQKPWLDQGHEPQTKLMPMEAAKDANLPQRLETYTTPERREKARWRELGVAR